MLIGVIAFQIAASEPVLAPLADLRFDLRKAPPPVAGEGDILIRAKRLDLRLKQLEPLGQLPVIPRAAFMLNDKTALSLDFSPKILPDGTISNRAMVTLHIRF